jgi:hypothetical protein
LLALVKVPETEIKTGPLRSRVHAAGVGILLIDATGHHGPKPVRVGPVFVRCGAAGVQAELLLIQAKLLVGHGLVEVILLALEEVARGRGHTITECALAREPGRNAEEGKLGGIGKQTRLLLGDRLGGRWIKGHGVLGAPVCE